MNSSPLFFFAGVQSCSLKNDLKGGTLHSTFDDFRDLEKGEQDLYLNHDVMVMYSTGLFGSGWGRGVVGLGTSLLVIIKFSLLRSDVF